MYAQFFGNFLLTHNIITTEQLIRAIERKSSEHIKLGTLAIHAGYMNASEVDQVVIMQTHRDARFGDIAIAEGFLTAEQVDGLVHAQSPDFLLLGQILVGEGIIDNHKLELIINDYESENELYDLDYSNEQNDIIDHLIKKFLFGKNRKLNIYESEFGRLLFNNLIRFIGEDFTPIGPTLCTEYPTNYCVSQKIYGKFGFTVYIDMPETTCIAFASRYVGDVFKTFDEYVQASLEDFLNLHNGLFNVNISNSYSVELNLAPPKVESDELLTFDTETYIMPVIYPFGTINFLFSDESLDES